MEVQARVLNRILYKIQPFEVVCFEHWVPSKMQPADPLSRLQSEFGGNRKQANARAWSIYDKLCMRLEVTRYMGVLVLGMLVPMKVVQLDGEQVCGARTRRHADVVVELSNG